MDEIRRIAREAREKMHQMPPLFTALGGGDALSPHNDLIEKQRQETKRKEWTPHGYDGLD